MEAFGKKLRDTREQKGLDFEQIARETNIARRYLEALEEENFEAFPGEPYLLGFLRNYCEYLGVNSSEMISAYRNLKIQEAPIPLKELMPKRPLSEKLLGNRFTPRLLIIAATITIVAGIVYTGIKVGGVLLETKPVISGESEVRVPAVYEVSGDTFRQRVFAGDSLEIKTASGDFTVTVAATAPALKLETPVGPRLVELGQDLMIDLSDDNQPDIIVFVADLFKNDPSKGADIHISTGESVVLTATAEAAAVEPEAADVIVATAESTAPAGTANRQQVLFEGGSAYPVTMNATFRGFCLFRYEADRGRREERYYQKSELLTVQAQNGIRVWASNGNAVKLQMVAGGKTVDIELSRPGEVIVRDLKWVRDEDTGRFKFVVLDVD